MFNVKRYVKEVFDEGRKINFPTKRDVYVTSMYIAVVIFFSSIFIALADFAISHVIKLIFGIGN